MDLSTKLDLFKRPPTEEILTVERLIEYIELGVPLQHYIGYEISGFLHLGSGIVPIHKVVDLQMAGVKTIIFLADYHSWINNKLGGDLDRIKKVAGGYYIDVFKKLIDRLGGSSSKTEFILASEFYEELGSSYFETFLKVSRLVTLSRVRRSVSILGRKMGEATLFSQLVYVPMQVADIFKLNVNVAHGGMDQRKAHVIAIDVGDEFGYKPIALHHRLVLGIGITDKDAKLIREALESGDKSKFVDTVFNIKMSKSLPDTAIFLHDDEETVHRKIRRAYCPPRDIKVNPIYSMFENIVYPYLLRKGLEFKVVNIKKGGEKTFKSIDEVRDAYLSGDIHPLDFKHAVATEIWNIIKPISEYLREGGGRRYIEELSEMSITR